MESIMKGLKKIAALFDSAMYVLVFASFGLLMGAVFIVCAEVVSRYVVNKPLTWVEQISGYILVYMVFLNAAWVLKKDRHVKLELLLMRLHPKTQTLFNLVTSCVAAVVCLIIAWFGADVTWDHFRRNVPSVEMLRFPMFIIWGIIPLGSFLLFVQFMRRTYGFLMTLRTLTEEIHSPKHE
jgi:C4-dicarboxylate transporter DctQ subunit